MRDPDRKPHPRRRERSGLVSAAAGPGLILVALTLLWLRFNVAPGGRRPTAMRMAVNDDLMNYYFGTLDRTAAILAAFDIPLWNPYACSGIPWLATLQSAAFYPGTWLAIVLPTEQALPILLFAECALGGWFCFLLFRTLGRSFAAALAGAILFIFCCMLGQTPWPPAVATIMWLPWLLLCAAKLAEDFSWRWWTCSAIGKAQMSSSNMHG